MSRLSHTMNSVSGLVSCSVMQCQCQWLKGMSLGAENVLIGFDYRISVHSSFLEVWSGQGL